MKNPERLLIFFGLIFLSVVIFFNVFSSRVTGSNAVFQFSSIPENSMLVTADNSDEEKFGTNSNTITETEALTADSITEIQDNTSVQVSGAKVNINTAGIDELQTLSGVGAVIAQRIIDYRQLNGAFLRVEDIMLVNGIGQGKFDKMKDYIEVK